MFKKALFKNLLRELIRYGKIKTTQKKAKILRGLVERVVNRAKESSLNKRYLLSLLPRTLVEKLVKEIAPQFKKKSGFTRIIKLGRRVGDNAPMVLIEFVEGAVMEKPETLKKPRRKRRV